MAIVSTIRMQIIRYAVPLSLAFERKRHPTAASAKSSRSGSVLFVDKTTGK